MGPARRRRRGRQTPGGGVAIDARSTLRSAKGDAAGAPSTFSFATSCGSNSADRSSPAPTLSPITIASSTSSTAGRRGTAGSVHARLDDLGILLRFFLELLDGPDIILVDAARSPYPIPQTLDSSMIAHPLGSARHSLSRSRSPDSWISGSSARPLLLPAELRAQDPSQLCSSTSSSVRSLPVT